MSAATKALYAEALAQVEQDRQVKAVTDRLTGVKKTSEYDNPPLGITPDWAAMQAMREAMRKQGAIPPRPSKFKELVERQPEAVDSVISRIYKQILEGYQKGIKARQR